MNDGTGFAKAMAAAYPPDNEPARALHDKALEARGVALQLEQECHAAAMQAEYREQAAMAYAAAYKRVTGNVLIWPEGYSRERAKVEDYNIETDAFTERPTTPD